MKSKASKDNPNQHQHLRKLIRIIISHSQTFDFMDFIKDFFSFFYFSFF